MNFELKPSFTSLPRSLQPSIKEVVKELCLHVIDTATKQIILLWIPDPTKFIYAYDLGDNFWCIEKKIIIKKILSQYESRVPNKIYLTLLYIKVYFRCSADKIDFLICKLSDIPGYDSSDSKDKFLIESTR